MDPQNRISRFEPRTGLTVEELLKDTLCKVDMKTGRIKRKGKTIAIATASALTPTPTAEESVQAMSMYRGETQEDALLMFYGAMREGPMNTSGIAYRYAEDGRSIVRLHDNNSVAAETLPTKWTFVPLTPGELVAKIQEQGQGYGPLDGSDAGPVADLTPRRPTPYTVLAGGIRL